MKGNPRTMRFDDDVEHYINSYKGNNFSERFHNLVRHFKDDEVFYEKRLTLLKKNIKETEDKLAEMNAMIRDVRWLDTALQNLKSDIKKSRDCFDAYLIRNTKQDGSQ